MKVTPSVRFAGLGSTELCLLVEPFVAAWTGLPPGGDLDPVVRPTVHQ